jgi:hypothetical protein
VHKKINPQIIKLFFLKTNLEKLKNENRTDSLYSFQTQEENSNSNSSFSQPESNNNNTSSKDDSLLAALKFKEKAEKELTIKIVERPRLSELLSSSSYSSSSKSSKSGSSSRHGQSSSKRDRDYDYATPYSSEMSTIFNKSEGNIV